jgi:flagellar basal body P-ring formation protein FlgA
MKFEAKLGLLLLLAPLVSTAMLPEPILRFQQTILPNAQTLGDIVLIKNDKQHWSALPLNSHPSTQDIITRDTITLWMAQQLGAIHYTWQGKTQTTVTQITQATGTQLIDKARTALIQKLHPYYSDITLSSLSHIQDSPHALDDFDVDIHLLYPTKKRVCVWLVSRTHHKQSIPIWFNVQAYARVFVATQLSRADTPIQPQAFTWKKQNIAGLNASPVLQFPKSAWLKTTVNNRAILTQSHLKKPPLIKQGEHVTLLSHHRDITLAMDTIAITNGDLKSHIRVKNSMNNTLFIATVTGRHTAEIRS